MHIKNDDRLKSFLWIVGIYVSIFLIYKAVTFNSSPLSPNREDLAYHNFYALVLPANIAEKYGWQEELSLYSWDIHCKTVDISETANPLTIKYVSENNEIGFSVSIDPWNTAWKERDSTEIEMHRPWIKGNVVTSYVLEPELKLKTKLRFIDMNHIPVYIFSTLPAKTTLELVESLEYLPPLDTTVTNPWSCERFRNSD